MFSAIQKTMTEGIELIFAANYLGPLFADNFDARHVKYTIHFNILNTLEKI